MLDKSEILFVILGLFFLFYIAIRLGAGKKRDIDKSKKMSNYLSNVRILIAALVIVGLILWFFL